MRSNISEHELPEAEVRSRLAAAYRLILEAAEMTDEEVEGEKWKQIHKGWIYLIKDGDLYKIGMSVNVADRFATIKRTNLGAELICSAIFDDHAKIERELHIKFAHKRVSGEWFALNNEDIDWLKDYLQGN